MTTPIVISDTKVAFAKKYMADEYFTSRIGGDYSNGEGLEQVSYESLQSQASKAEIWAYYDTGFNIVGELLSDEVVFKAFISRAIKQRYSTLRFYVKKVE